MLHFLQYSCCSDMRRLHRTLLPVYRWWYIIYKANNSCPQYNINPGASNCCIAHRLDKVPSQPWLRYSIVLVIWKRKIIFCSNCWISIPRNICQFISCFWSWENIMVSGIFAKSPDLFIKCRFGIYCFNSTIQSSTVFDADYLIVVYVED